MQKPLAPIVPVDFIMPEDTDDPTVFKVRPLTGAEYMRCMMMAGSAARNPENAAISTEIAVRMGLVGWENFGGAEFSDSQAENIARLNNIQFAAIGNEIIRLSKLHRDDKKK